MTKKKVSTIKKVHQGMAIAKAKPMDDGKVYIEGWANKAIKDRGNDLIESGEWDLKDFNKNAILLFNHDHTKPIGKVMSVEARQDGLYMKARISNSQDPEISRIRDLVQEEILNSLSVGISVKDMDAKGGTNYLRGVGLNEISIVSVPMNQDSQFSLSVKDFAGSMIKSLETLGDKLGHAEVSEVCRRIEKKFGDKLKLSSDIAVVIAEETGLDYDEAMDFLRMKDAAVPAKIKAFLEKSDDDFEPDTSEPSGSGANTPADGDGSLVEGDGTNVEQKDLFGNMPGQTVALSGQGSSSEINPALDQMRQTNVLLSNMVSLLQGILDKINLTPTVTPAPAAPAPAAPAVTPPPPAKEEEEEPKEGEGEEDKEVVPPSKDEEEETEEEKSIHAMLEKFAVAADQRLKKLGV